jgi:hypothetical protein
MLLLCAGLAGCASTDSASTPTPSGSRLSDMFATPDWAKFTGAEKKTFTRPVTPEDLIGADGACASAPAATTALANSDGGNAPIEAPPPAVSGGIALQMTECQVAQRAGLPQRVDIAANPAGERTAKLTYMGGPWPGIYSFTAGRLVTIDRVEVPPPPKVKKVAPPKKPPLRVNVGQ